MGTVSIIKFNITGNGARPESISMGELGDLLKHLEAAIKAAIPPELRIEHAATQTPLVSLVSVEEGDSSDMEMAVLDYGVPSLSRLTENLATSSYSNMPSDSQEHLSYISKWVSKRRFSFEFEENSALNIRRAIISRKHPVPSPLLSTDVVDGVTTVWGYLLQTGGEKPKSALLFPNGEKLPIAGDERVTKDLAQRLYEDVGIEGIATWRMSDWKMIAFKALRLLDYRPGSVDVEQSFKGLADASGGRWDEVEAESYIRSLRGEAEQ